jgi:3-methyladenine DNA glycosylase AlkD
MTNNLKKIISEIRAEKNPKKAEILQGFFKTGKGEYGEGDKFLGVVVPIQRRIVQKYFAEISLEEIQKLIKSAYHEERMIALLILVLKFQKGNEKEKKRIFDFYLKNTYFINNWDLVDLTAEKIVGAYLEKRDRKILKKLAYSKSLWERRIAILSTFWFIKNKEYKETFEIARILLGDKEDLIHKAVGWMLREIGKRIGKSVEEGFLWKYQRQMPRTMLRYAIERFPEEKRRRYLLHKN